MKNNNLHVLQYSTPVEGYFTLKQLQEHLYSEPQIPDAIPYRTSFFEPNWGFCLKHSELLRLKNVEYYVKINSKITKGSLTYGELKIPSTQGNKEEILFSTYICHPSMANNELSGPAICAALAKEIYKISNRRYNYRFVYVPETIGCLAFLKENLTELQQSVIAGFQVTCVGNNGPFSYLPSREENNLSDRLIKAVAIGLNLDLKVYPFQQRGSDERQYCHPRVNLPVASLMRSKYGNYKEYHTSGDNLNFISPEGLSGSFAFYWNMVNVLENNFTLSAKTIGEPNLGKRGLYSKISNSKFSNDQEIRFNILGYADGKNDLISLIHKLAKTPTDIIKQVNILLSHELIEMDKNLK